MNAPILVAGIDSSTQSCKVVIVDAGTGLVVRNGRAPHPNGTEIDPALWWAALGEAVGNAGGIADVSAISVAGQQHGLIALGHDGHPVRPALLWNDTRSAGSADDLVAELGAAAWADRVGLVPVASFTASKLRWMRDTEPDLAERIAAVALPHDWLTWRLRGYGPAGESPLGLDFDALVTDASEASGTAYWSPATGLYDSGLFERALGRKLRVAGIAIDEEATSRPASAAAVVVPRVVRSDEPAATLVVDVSLPGGAVAPLGLIVAAGSGDNAGAALALDLADGDVAVSLGTSGTVFTSTQISRPDDSGVIAGFADATGARLPIVTTLNAARILDAFGSLLGVSHEELGFLALKAPPGSGGLVLVPHLVGERTPNRPDATGTMTGMTPETLNAPFLARAAIEAMLCSLAGGVDALRSNGARVSRVILIGGASQNSAVQTIAATIFDVPVVVSAPGEYVAQGAAHQAVWALTGVRPQWHQHGKSLTIRPVPGVRVAYERALAASR